MPTHKIDAVVFDLGETLVNETRAWLGWAEWLDTSPLTLFGALGAVIAAREDHRLAFSLIRPAFDFEHERAAKEAAGLGWRFDENDLYPDAVPCLDELRSHGLRVGVVGNQPAGVESMLGQLSSRVDLFASSGTWGVSKPDAGFFVRVAEEMGRPPQSIAYVGDRLDNDVLPAVALGMAGVFLRRGPWGVIQARWPQVHQATIVIDSLAELPAALGLTN